MVIERKLDYGWVDSQATETALMLESHILEIISERHSTLNVLDYGCGNGYLSRRISMNGHCIVGFDLDEHGIEICKGQKVPNSSYYYSQETLSQDPKFGKFDVAILTDVIEHLYDPRHALRLIREALKPDGLLLVTTPYHGYFKNLLIALFGHWDKHHTTNWIGGHIRFYSRATLDFELERAGFTVVHHRCIGRVPLLSKSLLTLSTPKKTAEIKHSRIVA